MRRKIRGNLNTKIISTYDNPKIISTYDKIRIISTYDKIIYGYNKIIYTYNKLQYILLIYHIAYFVIQIKTKT